MLEKEEAKKYHSMELQQKKKFHIKLIKKHIRKLLDDKHRPTWKDTNKKEYKNLGSLAEWLILDYYTRTNREETNNHLSMLDYLRKENLELKKEIEQLKNS